MKSVVPEPINRDSEIAFKYAAKRNATLDEVLSLPQQVIREIKLAM